MDMHPHTCPDCGAPAEVLYRSTLPSTDGPVEHVKIRCGHGHWFFMEAAAVPVATHLVRAA